MGREASVAPADRASLKQGTRRASGVASHNRQGTANAYPASQSQTSQEQASQGVDAVPGVATRKQIEAFR